MAGTSTALETAVCARRLWTGLHAQADLKLKDPLVNPDSLHLFDHMAHRAASAAAWPADAICMHAMLVDFTHYTDVCIIEMLMVHTLSVCLLLDYMTVVQWHSGVP